MRLRLTNTHTADTLEFEADDHASFRNRLNPAITGMRQAIADEREAKAGATVRFEVQIWDPQEEFWVGPHLPNDNHERWVKPLTSDAEARWLWERLWMSLNRETADFRAFKTAYGKDQRGH